MRRGAGAAKMFGRSACVKKNGPKALTAKQVFMVGRLTAARSSIAIGGMIPDDLCVIHGPLMVKISLDVLTGNVKQRIYWLLPQSFLESLDRLHVCHVQTPDLTLRTFQAEQLLASCNVECVYIIALPFQSTPNRRWCTSTEVPAHGPAVEPHLSNQNSCEFMADARIATRDH